MIKIQIFNEKKKKSQGSILYYELTLLIRDITCPRDAEKIQAIRNLGHFLHLTRVYFVSSKELVPQDSDNYEVQILSRCVCDMIKTQETITKGNLIKADQNLANQPAEKGGRVYLL